MPSDLQRSIDALKQGIRAYEMAIAACDMDQRLRCVHNGIMHGKEAFDLATGWRQGKDDRQDACPTEEGAASSAPTETTETT